ncbi:MAG TPA: PQQ-binding-like beta-propeller repeat protein [Thermoanaerobaculia bacterium]|nr:PQQ-binding-like beta-propeller repeat protein [Thermoanaerobaculia bacterium]
MAGHFFNLNVTWMRTALSVAALVITTLLSAQPCKPVALNPSPAAIVWTVPVAAFDAALAGDTLVIETKSNIVAVDAASGVKRWESSIVHADASGRTDPMVVTNGRVFVSLGRELRILAMADGRPLRNVRMPLWIRMLTGPPLIAVANNSPRLGSTLFALDDDGRIRAQRIVRDIEEIWLTGQTVIARMTRNIYNEAPEMNVVAAFRASDLALLWQFRAKGAALQQIDGRWYVGDTAWSPMRSLDIATGHLGDFLPPKPPTEVIWGGATWQIETVTSSEKNEPPCDRLRVSDPATGKGWTIDLPFDVTNTLDVANHLYVFGSSDNTHHYLAELDWRSGRINHGWNGVPMLFDHMFVRGDLLVGMGITEGAVGIRLR